MSRDEIFSADDADQAPFEFNEDVAKVFPDMLRRSIPGYRATIQTIGNLAGRYVSANSRCYDLGASLGAATIAMRDGIAVSGCHVVAVDNSPAMVDRCRQALAVSRDKAQPDVEVSVIEADVCDVEISNASMVVMNYTLQFLPQSERNDMLRKIAHGTNEGGILLLSEKVVDPDDTVEQELIDLHHDFKRRNAYSDMEIARKRTALENVLVPESLDTHFDRLREAGYRHVAVWLRYFNFVSILAIR